MLKPVIRMIVEFGTSETKRKKKLLIQTTNMLTPASTCHNCMKLLFIVHDLSFHASPSIEHRDQVLLRQHY
jgi:hypothetical protein